MDSSQSSPGAKVILVVITIKISELIRKQAAVNISQPLC